jgi:hypothetical protein
MGPSGEAVLEDEQHPLVAADKHYGSPENSSVRYESEYALRKPLTDVIVHGSARSPSGRPVENMVLRLETPGRTKDLLVSGDRFWNQGVFGVIPSVPKPFVTMPVVYERAFGGMDLSHENPSRHGAELRNLVGVGFHCNHDTDTVLGRPVPNIEDPMNRVKGLGDRPAPKGFGYVGRSWHPRLRYAGTYDQHWLEELRPFLPADFDERYFQGAPEDQQCERFRGGEALRCHGMTESPEWIVRVPTLTLPVTFVFDHRREERAPEIDTVLLDSDQQTFMVIWRASIPAGKKIHALREIYIGHPPVRSTPVGPSRYLRGKPWFPGLEALAAWNRARRGGA